MEAVVALFTDGDARARAAKASLIVGVLTLIAAFFMPAVVAWDDARALEEYEQSEKGEPVKIFGFMVSAGQDFVAPSERGHMGPCVMLFMILIAFGGLAAFLLAIGGAASAFPFHAVGGALAGLGGVIVAAWLSPMGLGVLALIGVCMLLAMILPGIAASGGGC